MNLQHAVIRYNQLFFKECRSNAKKSVLPAALTDLKGNSNNKFEYRFETSSCLEYEAVYSGTEVRTFRINLTTPYPGQENEENRSQSSFRDFRSDEPCVPWFTDKTPSEWVNGHKFFRPKQEASKCRDLFLIFVKYVGCSRYTVRQDLSLLLKICIVII